MCEKNKIKCSHCGAKLDKYNGDSLLYDYTVKLNINLNSSYDKKLSKKNKNTFFYLLIYICIFLIFILVLYIAFNIISRTKYENNKELYTQEVKEIEEITISNYLFVLPKSLNYDNTNNYIYAKNYSENMLFKLGVIDIVYSNLLQDYNFILDEIKDCGWKVLSNDVFEYEGRELMVFSLKKENKYGLYVLTELDLTHSIQLFIMSSSESGYREGFKYMNDIIVSVKSNYITENIDESDIFLDDKIFDVKDSVIFDY